MLGLKQVSMMYKEAYQLYKEAYQLLIPPITLRKKRGGKPDGT